MFTGRKRKNMLNRDSSSPVSASMAAAMCSGLAAMNTIDPRTFVEFKRWTVRQEVRKAVKRRRDALQDVILQKMLETRMLTSTLDEVQ